MPFEGMMIKVVAKGAFGGLIVATLKPISVANFLEWSPKININDWVEFTMPLSTWANSLSATVKTKSVALMAWAEGSIVSTVVRGEFLKEADVKQEFLSAVMLLK